MIKNESTMHFDWLLWCDIFRCQRESVISSLLSEREHILVKAHISNTLELFLYPYSNPVDKTSVTQIISWKEGRLLERTFIFFIFFKADAHVFSLSQKSLMHKCPGLQLLRLQMEKWIIGVSLEFLIVRALSGIWSALIDRTCWQTDFPLYNLKLCKCYMMVLT